jgi:HEAT repeat protein
MQDEKQVARQIIYGPSCNLSEEEASTLRSFERPLMLRALNTIFREAGTYTYAKSRAFEAMLALPPPDTVQFLIDLYPKVTVDWKIAICDKLAFYSSPISVSFLCTVPMSAKNPNIRYAAVEALEVIGSERAIPALEHAIAHDKGKDFEGFPISKAAINALSSINQRLAKNL